MSDEDPDARPEPPAVLGPSDGEWAAPSPEPAATETPLSRSQAAFRADLPELLTEYRGKWVAYADGTQVRIGNTQAELYRHCLHDRGLSHDRFVVRRIAPEGSPQIEYNPR